MYDMEDVCPLKVHEAIEEMGSSVTLEEKKSILEDGIDDLIKLITEP
jgi:hypothetical protein